MTHCVTFQPLTVASYLVLAYSITTEREKQKGWPAKKLLIVIKILLVTTTGNL